MNVQLVIILMILYVCSFIENIMSTHRIQITDRIHKRMLRYMNTTKKITKVIYSTMLLLDLMCSCNFDT